MMKTTRNGRVQPLDIRDSFDIRQHRVHCFSFTYAGPFIDQLQVSARRRPATPLWSGGQY